MISMACWYRILTPYNYKSHGYKVYYPAGSSTKEKIEALEPIIDRYQDYIENGWLSENHENYFCTENNIKRMLDSMGSMLLRGAGARDVISAYKQERIDSMECSLDEILERQYNEESGYYGE